MTMRLASWNVNGIRSIEKKGFLKWLKGSGYDVVGLQETKCAATKLPAALAHPDGYETFLNPATREGYSGTTVYSRVKPLSVKTFFKDPYLDGEGRIIMLEFKRFYYFNVYFPNGKMGPRRLAYKLEFYDRFLKLAEALRKKKPIVFCGDVNTAHAEIDLARPKENSKISGFLPIERQWIDKVIARGYLDTFRLFEKGGGHYSWWAMKSRERERNVGWRIDYFFVSDELKKNVKRAWIEKEALGSDHCPVGLELKI